MDRKFESISLRRRVWLKAERRRCRTKPSLTGVFQGCRRKGRAFAQDRNPRSLTPTANVGEQIRVQKPDLRDRYRGFETPLLQRVRF
jgi:hypothetical protein